jgi:hypothetical protein
LSDDPACRTDFAWQHDRQKGGPREKHQGVYARLRGLPAVDFSDKDHATEQMLSEIVI